MPLIDLGRSREMDTNGITRERVNKNMLISDSYSLFALSQFGWFCMFVSHFWLVGPFNFCVEQSTPTFYYGTANTHFYHYYSYCSASMQAVVGKMSDEGFRLEPNLMKRTERISNHRQSVPLIFKDNIYRTNFCSVIETFIRLK